MSDSQQLLQSQLEELVARHQLPGAVAAVWRDGELATAAAGTANGNTGVPMTADTAFATGSITKVWATTMYHTLIEDGVLDLDELLVEYAPDIQFGADRDVAGSLTFRNLLNHSSGVDSGDLFVPTRPYPAGVEDYLGPLTWAGKLTEPGVVSSYNNDGWIIGELVMRRVTGKDFHQLLRERVIGPMGLRRTVLSADEAMLHRTAIGHYPGPDGRHHPTPQFLYPDTWAAPGTTNITTVEDTISFLRLHLAGGVTADGTRVLSTESVQAMQTPTSPWPTGPQSGFGLGWMYHEENGRRVFSHGGGSLGGVAHAMISPEHNLAVVSFANSSIGNPLHADLLDLVFPAGPSPLATPAAPARTDVPLEPFTGTFRRKTERTDISQDSGQLVVRVTPVLAELAGATVTRTGEVGEFRAVPTSENSAVSCGDLPGGVRTLTFHEEAPGGFQLMFSGRRLARRISG